jgi:hypothetical protein
VAGPCTLETRREILDRLLRTQAEVTGRPSRSPI